MKLIGQLSDAAIEAYLRTLLSFTALVIDGNLVEADKFPCLQPDTTLIVAAGMAPQTLNDIFSQVFPFSTANKLAGRALGRGKYAQFCQAVFGHYLPVDEPEEASPVFSNDWTGTIGRLGRQRLRDLLKMLINYEKGVEFILDGHKYDASNFSMLGALRAESVLQIGHIIAPLSRWCNPSHDRHELSYLTGAAKRVWPQMTPWLEGLVGTNEAVNIEDDTVIVRTDTVSDIRRFLAELDPKLTVRDDTGRTDVNTIEIAPGKSLTFCGPNGQHGGTIAALFDCLDTLCRKLADLVRDPSEDPRRRGRCVILIELLAETSFNIRSNDEVYLFSRNDAKSADDLFNFPLRDSDILSFPFGPVDTIENWFARPEYRLGRLRDKLRHDNTISVGDDVVVVDNVGSSPRCEAEDSDDSFVLVVSTFKPGRAQLSQVAGQVLSADEIQRVRFNSAGQICLN